MVTNQPAIFLFFLTLTDQGPWVLMEISVPFFLVKYLNTDLHQRHQRGHEGKTQTLKMLTFSLQECRLQKSKFRDYLHYENAIVVQYQRTIRFWPT